MQACDGYQKWETSRRNLLKASALGAIAWLAPSAISQLTVAPKPRDTDTLVVVFLRGGADGLNIVAPYADDLYAKMRPTLRLRRPGEGPRIDQALDLDGYFGLHPGLAPILPLYQDGQLGIVHAVGSFDQSRSHFEAMSAMERGLPDASTGDASGWLGRYLNAVPREGALRAVSFGEVTPDSLRGGLGAVSVRSLLDYRLAAPPEFAQELESLYREGRDEMARAGQDTLRLLKVFNELNYSGYSPANGAAYPDTDLGNGLRQAAFLIKNELGVEVVALDTHGWDTHVTQGVGEGWHAGLVSHMGTCLRAFADDMKGRLDRTSVIVMTEFGRRLYENGGFGTDHGRASVLFALGGAVKGGRVHGRWPGLREEDQEGPGDLKVTTDYRQVLAEALTKRMGVPDTSPVFKNLRATPVGLF